jgi:heme A synthase
MPFTIWLVVGLFYALMVSGNVISSTGSFTCPDWILCFVTFASALSQATRVETVHRILAVALMILTAGVLHQVLGKRGSRLGANPKLKRLGQALILILSAQFGLGIAMMFLGFSPVASTVHFLLATLVFSGLIVIACAVTWTDPVVRDIARNGDTTEGKTQGKIKRLAVAGLGAVGVQLLLGAIVRHTHAGLACPGFPGCGPGFFPSVFTFETSLAWVHRWWGVLTLGLFFHLALTTSRVASSLAKPAGSALVLSLMAILLGIGSVVGGLSMEFRALHAGVAYLLWGILLSIAIRAGALKLS